MAWDLIEFITICSRRGRGIPPKIHMWADSCIFIGTAAGTGIVVVRIIGEAVDSSGLWLLKGQIITASFLVVLMSVYSPSSQPNPGTRPAFVREVYPADTSPLRILHSILLFLFVCNCLERKERKDTKPRVMYLPTGEPVVVLPQPCTTKPASKQPAVLVSRMRRSTSAPAQDVLEDEIITPPSPVADEPVEHNALPPQPEPEPQVPPAAPKPSPVEVEGRTEPFRQGVPPRKPVPGTFVGTPYATPWLAPEYEITEEERDRATRGESQAQWVSLYAGGLSGPATRVTGANGEKSLANV